MDQQEIKEFLIFCTCVLKGVTTEYVEESEHYFFRGDLVGGFAGDTNSYFITNNHTALVALKMMEAEKSV